MEFSRYGDAYLQHGRSLKVYFVSFKTSPLQRQTNLANPLMHLSVSNGFKDHLKQQK